MKIGLVFNLYLRYICRFKKKRILFFIRIGFYLNFFFFLVWGFVENDYNY